MARKNKKRGRKGAEQTVVVRVELALVGDKRMGVSAMSYDNESGDEERHEPESGEQHDEASTEGDSGSNETLKALDGIERFHEQDREEFARMAAVQELGPQLKEALNILLALSPEALETLASIARLPEDEKRVIRRAVSLSDEVKAALRGLLDE
jgi:hypothetical protein